MQVQDSRSATPLAAAGDNTFAAYYDRHWKAVVAVVSVLCRDVGVAEDLAQEAFLRAYGRWRRVSQLDRPDLWVRRVAVNLAVSRFRRVQAEARALARTAGRRRHDQAPLSAVEDDIVWNALRTLQGRQLQVAALFYIDDRSIAETADLLGCAEGTVKSHLHAARERLRAVLGEGLEDEHA